jgi:hypothetical protein
VILVNLLTWTRGRIALLAFAITLVGASPQPGPSQGRTSAEYERKATFIYNLIRFIDWPEDAFRDASDSLRLVIVGHDPFNGALERRFAVKRFDHRTIVVVHSASDVAPTPGHIVFLAASEEKHLARVLAAYCHVPVLTVSDIDHFAARGGVIGLVMEDQAVRFAINRTAADEARLHINAQVFHLAVPLFSAVSPCR